MCRLSVFFGKTSRHKAHLTGCWRCAAHEALKQLAFAKEKIGFRERRGMIKQFCARPRVEKSLETCRMAWIGEKWKRLAIWLMKKKRYGLALRYYDALQVVRQIRNQMMQSGKRQR